MCGGGGYTKSHGEPPCMCGTGHAHTKMVPEEAGDSGGGTAERQKTGSPAPQRVTLLGMSSKQILNNQPNKAVKPFRNEINKQYVIIITRVTLRYRLSAIFI